MLIQILIIILVAVFFLLGLAGTVVPVLPGPLFVLAGAFIWAWYSGFAEVTWVIVAVLAALALVSQALDYLASMLGAKKFGASRWGIAGSLVGALVGIFFGIIGIIVGPFLGAVVFEILHGKSLHSSLKIGFGTLVGFLGGAVGKIIITVTMIGIFVVVLL
ncbi:DUF456 domain-containing protein [Thermodesulfobacteriota bacterium]